LVVPAFIEAIQVALFACTRRLLIPVFQMLSSGKTVQLVPGTGALSATDRAEAETARVGAACNSIAVEIATTSKAKRGRPGIVRGWLRPCTPSLGRRTGPLGARGWWR
jgi:hypothetical protein